MYNPFSLQGKTVLITGASSGIGKATAIECSKMGANVVITGRNEERLNETFEALQGENNKKFLGDLTLQEDVEKLANQLPALDGIVHSAGISGDRVPFSFISSEKIKSVFDINFFTPALFSKALLKAKKLQNGASIVFISSIGGAISPAVAHSIYCASKSAVSAMAKCMALDLSAKKIRANCICPGMIETPMAEYEGITQEQYEADKNKYPLKRYGKPEEVAYAVIYLLSDASCWITGTNLTIDGGITLL
jgi:NAD(P)-dependent dehydrogenase (short-subunit alcohol dehydrogenase family)